MNLELLDNKYEVLKNVRDALNKEELTEVFTDYFSSFDYILGDYAYGKLRLKGFYNKDNKNCKNYNDFSKIDEYIEKYCAYGCRHFILNKVI